MNLPIRPRKLLVAASLLIFIAHFAVAEGTRTWEQSKFEDLIKGTGQGVAIRSNGGLELAPAFKALSTTPSTYIWAIAADQGGNLYAATGAPARIYRITPGGESSVIFEPQELQVQSLVVDKSGVIYAATNPDGKIYRIEHRKTADASKATPGKPPATDASWSATPYFDPATKYIWDLLLDDAGNLYAATGDHGEIFRVTPKGEHSVLFKSDEAHIRVLALDPKGNLIAGSDGSGLVYRISPAGEGFVLYSAPKKEITALAIDAAGNIYAAGAGEKRPGAAPTPGFAPMVMPAPTQAPAAGQATITITNVTPIPQPAAGIPTPAMGATGGSEIYRIAPDGSPSRLWTSREDLVYALAFDQRGHLLAGTGNRGHIFSITGDDNFTDLVKASATQVTAFANAPSGGLYVSTSNLGKVFLLGPAVESEGSYESDVFDAHIFSRWGRVEMRSAGKIEMFTRSGNVDNPDRNWSPWKRVDLLKDAAVSVPPARFIQWKTLLHAAEVAPRLDSVLLNYLPQNVAPDFDEVTVQAGVRYLSLPKPADSGGSAGANQPHFDQPPPTTHDSDSIGVRWTVHDDNDDQMVYSVYYRGDGETRWLLLKDQLTDKFYSFDASLLPDGGYTVKVVASDGPSHSPDQALTAERESARFEVDTTAPQIENLTASVQGSEIHVGFRALDSFSAIKRAEYSVDAGDWQFVEPVGQLSDSKTESYDFRVAIPSDPAMPTPAKAIAAGQLEHVIVVRVYDRYDNMSSAKTVVRGK
ncbi:MAG: hypothetical protein LAO03_03850 [Acidobacteriia bacterium]|nr:hypothetical protein [Terriglobia bacterium]